LNLYRGFYFHNDEKANSILDGFTITNGFVSYTTPDWLETADEQPGDLDRNGMVDFYDLTLLTEDWLKATSWHE